MTDWMDFTVQYPAGAGTELDEQQIRQLLAGAKSWDERYRRLLQLTKQVPAIPVSWRHPDHEVSGCESRVWLLLYKDGSGRCHFAVDS